MVLQLLAWGGDLTRAGKKLYQGFIGGLSTAVATSCEVDLGDLGNEQEIYE
ncbi:MULTISPECIES: hypothetical protein [unclassified Coleofasciculus]|uniref:hypothetical protein n=1 Tax=Cyanophyceae TaxID=3028117 RepID=UPI0016869DD7|nr:MULTISPECIES: hypothetical protein [unclassified Coleofasciculus]MBD1881337.1 hypothetical protein [Coleofasciculus sp. FACHB-T130]MBD1896090.1 hypothetical protein [Coleofasciculus sp. FACHB-129]